MTCPAHSKPDCTSNDLSCVHYRLAKRWEMERLAAKANESVVEWRSNTLDDWTGLISASNTLSVPHE